MKSQETIREEIFRLVREFWSAGESAGNREFIPGQSAVQYAGRVYDAEELVSLVDSSLDFWLTAGRYASRFENEFAKYLGAHYALLTNSGSSANLLAISSLTSLRLGERRLRPGDEVIAVAASFPTTVNPIVQNNLIPVFCDVDIGTYNINIEELKASVSPKTRAIFIAHTLGNPFNLEEVTNIAKENNLFLIEDCCDALGSEYSGKKVGTFGDISTYSFYPAHHITMGEGGAVATSNPVLKVALESFRDWGRDCYCPPGKSNTCGKRFGWQLGGLPFGYDHKYIYSHAGYNLKVTDMQAAIGVAQLKKLSFFTKKRKENFKFLFNRIKKYDKFLILPKATDNADPSWFGFLLTVRPEAPFKKADIVSFLENRKIATRMLFAGNITKQPYFQDKVYRVVGDLKNSDLIMTNTFWIGVYPGMTDAMLNFMANSFDDFFNSLSIRAGSSSS